MTDESIFTAALALKTDSERQAYLDEVCKDNSALRAEVEALLQADAGAGSFLNHPPAGADATIAIGAEHDTVDSDAGPVSLAFLQPCETPGRIGKLDHYEIIEVVGQGGMGVVLRALDTKLSRIVAVKVMAPELAANPQAVKRFLREAKTAAAVHHDHVVTIHAVEDQHRPPYIVMQFIDGQTLQQKIDKEGSLELREILRIGSQMAAGLAAAHKHGLIHRDVKPANILLENGVERVKITDFGLARAADDLEMTQAGIIAGTPQYMSPEQAKGEPVDSRSDLFSLGSVLYTMCTGRPGFRAETTMGVLKRVCEDTPRPIREVNVEIPAWMEAIVAKLLAKDPSDRFQSAVEVSELLSQHLAHEQNPAQVARPATVSLPAPPQKPINESKPVEWLTAQQRHRRSLAIATLIFGLIAWAITIPLAAYLMIGRPDTGSLHFRGVGGVSKAQIEISRNGQFVDMILFPQSREVNLKPGQYELAVSQVLLPGATQAATLWYPQAVTVVRGTRTTVELRWVPGDAPAEGTVIAGDGTIMLSAPVPIAAELHQLLAESAGDWKPLFNGRDLAGWTPNPDSPGNWRVEDGVLIGSGPSSLGLLHTDRDDYEDFHLRAEVLIEGEAADGGIFFRAAPQTSNELNLCFDPKLPTQQTGSLVVHKPTTKDSLWTSVPAGLAKLNEWMTLEILVLGDQALTKVNGRTAAVSRELCGNPRGQIVLQHLGSGTVVRFRKIEIKELPTQPALQFDGVDDLVTAPSIPFDQFKAFTVEAWVKDWRRGVLCQGQAADPENSFWLSIGSLPIAPDSHFPALCSGWEYGTGTNVNCYLGDPPQGVWTHVAMVFDGQQQHFFVGGRLIQAKLAPPPGPMEANRNLVFGAHDFPDGLDYGAGMLGPVRISSVARWVDDFDPPEEYTPDAQTELLYAMQDQDPKQLLDISGKSRHGVISGATRIKKKQSSSADGFVRLFDGQSLAGWKTEPGKTGWKAEYGKLIGSGSAGFLTSDKEFGDFHLRARVRISEDGDSGIYFRCQPDSSLPRGVNTGYEAQIIGPGTESNRTGSLYKFEQGQTQDVALFVINAVQADEWFDYEIIAQQGRITLEVNGEKLTDYTDPRPFTKGRLALDLFQDRGRVEFERIEIKELPAGQTAPPQPAIISRSTRVFTGEITEKGEHSVFSSAWSPEGDRAVTGHFGGAVAVWDFKTGKQQHAFAAHRQTVHALAFDPKDKLLASGGEDSTIRLWNTETWEAAGALEGHTGRIAYLAFIEDGASLISVSWDFQAENDNTIRVWDVSEHKVRQTHVEPVGHNTHAALAPGEKLLAVANAASSWVRLWDLEKGSPAHDFLDQPTQPVSVAFSRDGTRVAAGYMARERVDGEYNDPANSVVRMWDVQSAKLLQEFKGHAGPVVGLEFSPDDRHLLSLAGGRHDASSQFVNSSDQILRIWEVATGRELVRIDPQTRINVARWTPDGRGVWSGLRVWDVSAALDEQSP